MMQSVVAEMARAHGRSEDIEITISIPGGEALAAKTWNPRLGIVGGLSVLGTTGVVRPFSCAAWIASIHRGIDVARADGLAHVAGCTGAQSERAVQDHHTLPDHAMLDMGDFAGGLMKYLAKHPVPRLTIGGGIAKMTKLSQGALDLHSSRSQVDLRALASDLDAPEIAGMNTALEAYQTVGAPMAEHVAGTAQLRARSVLGRGISVDVIVTNRRGEIIAQAGP